MFQKSWCTCGWKRWEDSRWAPRRRKRGGGRGCRLKLHMHSSSGGGKSAVMSSPQRVLWWVRVSLTTVTWQQCLRVQRGTFSLILILSLCLLFSGSPLARHRHGYHNESKWITSVVSPPFEWLVSMQSTTALLHCFTVRVNEADVKKTFPFSTTSPKWS